MLNVLRRANPGFLFVLPVLFFLLIFILYPLISTLHLSVTNGRGDFVGVDNFQYVLSDPVTRMALRNSVIYVGFSIFFQVIIGTVAGIVLNQPFPGRGLLRSLILIPWVIPGIVAATTWAWMYHTEFGIINYTLVQAGLIDAPQGWLTNPRTVLPALIAVNTWKMYPFVAVMVLAGLQGIPSSLYEAARVDGASFLQETRYITLPQLRPVLSSVFLLLMIWGFNAITIIYTMTGGGPANLSIIIPIQIFRQAFEFFEFNLAAATSVLLFAILSILIFFYLRFVSSEEVAGA